VTDRVDSIHRALYAAAGFVAVIVLGTICFSLVVGESVGAAVYRTLITISTAGLVTAPASAGAKAITAVLVILGVAIYLYVFGLIIELIVGGALSGAVQQRRIGRRVEGLGSHYVICGYGRMGRRIASELRAGGVGFIVVDPDPAAVAAAQTEGHLALEGGGADHTVSPYSIAGREVATMMLRPQVAAFLDVFSGAGTRGIQVEQIEVTAACDKAGSTIRELVVQESTGALVIAHRRRGGDFTTRLDPDLRLEVGDGRIGVGTPDEIRALEELFRPREPVA
jgi:Trk K+ transport system NAD-binding subunit